jgi:LPXTG-motif cell wall-anchored protein
MDPATCGYPFEEGETYLVYAHSDGTPLTTSLYHRTQALERAEEDLDVLGTGSEVEEETTTSDGDDFNSAMLLLGAVILSLILAGVMLLRKHKPGLENRYDTDDHYDAGNDDPARPHQ